MKICITLFSVVQYAESINNFSALLHKQLKTGSGYVTIYLACSTKPVGVQVICSQKNTQKDIGFAHFSLKALGRLVESQGFLLNGSLRGRQVISLGRKHYCGWWNWTAMKLLGNPTVWSGGQLLVGVGLQGIGGMKQFKVKESKYVLQSQKSTAQQNTQFPCPNIWVLKIYINNCKRIHLNIYKRGLWFNHKVVQYLTDPVQPGLFYKHLCNSLFH